MDGENEATNAEYREPSLDKPQESQKPEIDKPVSSEERQPNVITNAHMLEQETQVEAQAEKQKTQGDNEMLDIESNEN